MSCLAFRCHAFFARCSYFYVLFQIAWKFNSKLRTETNSTIWLYLFEFYINQKVLEFLPLLSIESYIVLSILELNDIYVTTRSRMKHTIRFQCQIKTCKVFKIYLYRYFFNLAFLLFYSSGVSCYPKVIIDVFIDGLQDCLHLRKNIFYTFTPFLSIQAFC